MARRASASQKSRAQRGDSPPRQLDGRLVDATRELSARCKSRYARGSLYFLPRKGARPAARPGGALPLGNGARLERINWLGDTSEQGIAQAPA